MLIFLKTYIDKITFSFINDKKERKATTKATIKKKNEEKRKNWMETKFQPKMKQ